MPYVLSEEFHQQVRDVVRRILAEPIPPARNLGDRPRLQVSRVVGFLFEDLPASPDPREQPQHALLNIYTWRYPSPQAPGGRAPTGGGTLTMDTLAESGHPVQVYVSNYFDMSFSAGTFMIAEAQLTGEWWPISANCSPTPGL